jgi:uncharacterized membrane protein YgdD (TMEM256/DUF423 family)
MGARAAVRTWEATGALGCALAVALGGLCGAWPRCGGENADRAGLALPVPARLTLTLLAARQSTRLERAALGCWLAGMVLFCGSVIGAVLAGFSTRLAPVGGLLLIAGWLLQAVAALRR